MMSPGAAPGRTVVLIDPEDRGTVEWIVAAMFAGYGHGSRYDQRDVDVLQTALRAHAERIAA